MIYKYTCSSFSFSPSPNYLIIKQVSELTSVNIKKVNMYLIDLQTFTQ